MKRLEQNDHLNPQRQRCLVSLRRVRRNRARRGVALVMVLGALTVLTILLAEFQTDASTELGSSIIARDSIQAEYAAMSAINLSRLLIAAEPTIRQTLAPLYMMMQTAPPQIPVWQFADKVLGAFNDDTGAKAFQGLASVDLSQGKNLGLGLPGVGFDIQIIDEDAMIDLNSSWHDLISQGRLSWALIGLMRPASYDAMFENRDADGQYSDRETICAAIIDWVDENEERFPCGEGQIAVSQPPEDNFYQMLDPPYRRKNAPFDSLEELRLVRGIGDDFWQGFIEPDVADPTKRAVTVWGRGKVNVNTANAQTLFALICGTGGGELPKMCTDVEEAGKFFSIMTLVKSMTAGAPLFPSAKAFLNALAQKGPYGQVLATLGLDKIQLTTRKELEKLIDVQSKVFSIIATGHVLIGKRKTQVRLHAVVDFRGAPKPEAADTENLDGTGGNAGTPSPIATGSGGAAPALPEGATADAIVQALLANPAGKIVYFRVE